VHIRQYTYTKIFNKKMPACIQAKLNGITIFLFVVVKMCHHQSEVPDDHTTKVVTNTVYYTTLYGQHLNYYY